MPRFGSRYTGAVFGVPEKLNMALPLFFFDGNKRTSRFMMNGVLMSHGIDAISVPAGKAQEFNEKMIRFYLNRDADEMMQFLVDCHSEAVQIRESNP